MDPLSETDVIQTEIPENFVAKLRPADVGRVVVLTAGMLLIKLTFFPHRLKSNSNSSTVFCFTEQNSNSVLFHCMSQSCRLLKVLLSRFSSEVDVVF